MGKIIKLTLKQKPNRLQALHWLSVNFKEFPKTVESKVSDDLFHGWRFIKAFDGL